jgi:hypothetical protein
VKGGIGVVVDMVWKTNVLVGGLRRRDSTGAGRDGSYTVKVLVHFLRTFLLEQKCGKIGLAWTG